MSAAATKQEIVEILDQLSDEQLVRTLDWLRNLGLQQEERLNNPEHIHRHFTRYDHVLKKLAE